MDELYIIIYIYSTEIERQKLNLFCYTRVGVLSKRYNICLHLFSNCAHNLEILPLVAKGCEIEAYDQNVRGSFKKYVDNVVVRHKKFLKKSNLTHRKIQNNIFYQQVMFQLI